MLFIGAHIQQNLIPRCKHFKFTGLFKSPRLGWIYIFIMLSNLYVRGQILFISISSSEHGGSFHAGKCDFKDGIISRLLSPMRTAIKSKIRTRTFPGRALIQDKTPPVMNAKKSRYFSTQCWVRFSRIFYYFPSQNTSILNKKIYYSYPVYG